MRPVRRHRQDHRRRRERSPSRRIPGASGCGDEGGHNFTVTVHLAVTKATGKLAKAKGTLKLTGAYSHDDGSFTVKVTGTLTK